MVGHTNEVNDCAFFPGEDLLISVSNDMTCKLFDVSGTGAGIQWPDMSFQAAEGKMVKAASSNRLLVARTRTASDSLRNLGPSSTTSRSQRGAHCGAVTSSLVSGIVEVCVTGAEDGEVKVWS